jgi:hypothetical protein
MAISPVVHAGRAADGCRSRDVASTAGTRLEEWKGWPSSRPREGSIDLVQAARPIDLLRRENVTKRGVTVDDVRAFAMTLPRTTEALVRDRIKFRVGRIVYLAFSRDEAIMGFGFPKDEREALVASEPAKFLMPEGGDLRYHWVQVRLDAIDLAEMCELVLDAWRGCIPKRIAAEYDAR